MRLSPGSKLGSYEVLSLLGAGGMGEVAKVYQVDPLVCTHCGQRMSILAFVSDQHFISRILEHLGLRSPELDRPPPAHEIREITRVAEAGEGWGVPASWD